MPRLSRDGGGQRWGIGDWEGAPSYYLALVSRPHHTVPVFYRQKKKTAIHNIDRMQTPGEFDFNINRGSETEGDSTETWHEGEEQSPTNGGHNYTFADHEWDGDYHPLLEDDFHAPPPSPRRLRKRCRPPIEPLQQYKKVPTREREGRGSKKL